MASGPAAMTAPIAKKNQPGARQALTPSPIDRVLRWIIVHLRHSVADCGDVFDRKKCVGAATHSIRGDATRVVTGHTVGWRRGLKKSHTSHRRGKAGTSG